VPENEEDHAQAADQHANWPTIRWYEEVGLLPRPARTDGGHRMYDGQHLARLDFIRHARELGFPLDAVRALLTLSDRPDQPCEDAHALASSQLASWRTSCVGWSRCGWSWPA